MLKKILVPLDGSDVTEGILPYVTLLAKAVGATLALHTTVDPETTDVSPSVSPAQLQANLEAHAKNRLESIARGLQEEGITVGTSVGVGKPAERILQAAAEEDCDLIAMATHGRDAIARAILGSVTDKVLHSSRVPVLCITPEKAREYQGGDGAKVTSVIAPLDGSRLAETSLPHVEELAHALSLEVTLVRAIRTAYTGFPEAGVSVPDLTEQAQREARDYLDKVARELRGRGLNVRTQVMLGAPAPALESFVHENPESIIVITTHGRSGVTRWLMGSVAEALVRSSGAPVTVIPAGA